MSRSNTLLSGILTDVANAVASTQKELDRFADESPGDLPLPALALVVKHTEVTLLGNLSMQAGESPGSQDRALSFALVNRVQAGLRGGNDGTVSARVSVSIQAVERPHGS
jgi:hypothetical protein